jgi:hypothetical protein
MDANQERMETNRQADREKLQETMKTNQDDLLKTVKEEIKAYHEEMMAMLDANHERTKACLGKMEADTEKTEPNTGMMQSTEEHQEIPKGEATVMPVGEPRKRRRIRNLAAEHRQKRKERTRENRGSRRKSAAACRKVSRHAKVAWRKRNIARKDCTWASVVQEIQRGWTFGRGCQQEPECSNCIRSRGVEEQVHRSKGKKTAKSIRGWRRHQP